MSSPTVCFISHGIADWVQRSNVDQVSQLAVRCTAASATLVAAALTKREMWPRLFWAWAWFVTCIAELLDFTKMVSQPAKGNPIVLSLLRFRR